MLQNGHKGKHLQLFITIIFFIILQIRQPLTSFSLSHYQGRSFHKKKGKRSSSRLFLERILLNCCIFGQALEEMAQRDRNWILVVYWQSVFFLMPYFYQSIWTPEASQDHYHHLIPHFHYSPLSLALCCPTVTCRSPGEVIYCKNISWVWGKGFYRLAYSFEK